MTLKRTLLIVGALLLIVVIVIGGWMFYDAWRLGVLPWQPEPTPFTGAPFSDLPTPDATP